MSFIKNIFDNSKEHSALLFEDNKIKIIKLKESDNNFFPLYWNMVDFDFENLIDKSEMIDLFKKIRSNLKTSEINFDIIYNDRQNIENEIIGNLKIAGFQNIHSVNWNFNINTLSINKNEFGITLFSFSPDGENLELNYLEHGTIRKKQLVKISEINSEKIKYFIDNTDSNHIFISGYFKNNINDIKNKFYDLGIKVHIFNIWENILSFKKNIPSIFKNESHEYIKVVSLALPPQEEILYEKYDIKEKEIENNKNKSKPEEEINVDFILDNEKEEKVIIEKSSLIQKIKNLFNRVILGPKESKSFKYTHEENHILNKKIYLPKPRLKLFLPKPKLLLDSKHSFRLVKKDKKILNKEKEKNNISSKKKLLKKPLEKNNLSKTSESIFDKVIFGPKESKSFKYYYDKDHWLNKEINFKFSKK